MTLDIEKSIPAIVKHMRTFESGLATAVEEFRSGPLDRLQASTRSITDAAKHLCYWMIIASILKPGVTIPRIVQLFSESSSWGSFSYQSWEMRLYRSCYLHAVLGTQGAKRATAILGSVIAHELCHCEQYWRIARLITSRQKADGLTPSLTKYRFPPQVCSDAVKTAALTRDEIKETEPWFEQEFGSMASHGGDYQKEKKIKLKPVPGSKWADVGKQHREASFARYQKLNSLEFDAHRIQFEVARQFLIGSTINPEHLLKFKASDHKKITSGVSPY